MLVTYTASEKARLEQYCSRHKLKVKEFIARGHSARIFLVVKGKKKLAAKIERDDSPRKKMLEREAFNLTLANSIGVGPKLVAYDFHARILLMEFVEGKTFKDWIFEKKRKKTETKKFLDKLIKQAKKLDSIGLDHGQLAGRGVNILVKKGKPEKPVIIDFEKASSDRKCHNSRVIESVLFKNKKSAITKRITKLLK